MDLLQWLGNWIFWVVVGGGLAVAELLTMDFVLIMLAGGAFAAAIAAAISGSGVIAVIVGVVVAVAMLAAVRPYAIAHYRKTPTVKTGVQALEGRQALVTEQVSRHGGRVQIDGETWSARSYDETAVIEAGKTVDVMKIDGATAYVFAIDEHLELE